MFTSVYEFHFVLYCFFSTCCLGVSTSDSSTTTSSAGEAKHKENTCVESSQAQEYSHGKPVSDLDGKQGDILADV